MTVESPERGTTLSDQSLLRRYQGGSQEAATALYHRYAQRIQALAKAQCSPELARFLEPADVVQSVFGAFFEKAIEGHYVVPAGQDLWRLLLVITLNKIRSKGAFYGAAKRHAPITYGAEDFSRLLQNKEVDGAADGFLQLVVREILESLPAANMAMMELRLQGHSVAEIAAKTERSKRTVERVLQEFRAKLATILQEDLPGTLKNRERYE